MESLLRWSIQNSTPLDSAPSDRPPARREDLNPEIIDMILGKSDAELMKEDVAVAVDTSKSEDERLNALDHLEMLIEQIDNANNLEKLKLWEPLQSILTSDASKEIKVATLWVIGTAVQNNPAAQDVYRELKPLPTILSFLSPQTSTIEERSKAIYTLSGLLKHNAPALKDLSQSGWETLRNALQDPAISVRRKAVFLLSALLIPTDPGPHPHAAHQAPLMLSDAPANLNAQPSTAVTSIEGPSVNVLTPDNRPANPENPIHPNSHAAHLRDSSRSQTSAITLEAFGKYGLLDKVISSIVTPLPHGPDGDHVGPDHDYEEKALRLLHTYAVPCRGPFTPEEKATLKKWISDAGTQSQLEERWNFTSEEYSQLVAAL
ncbi:adenyl-nucleotide exchange factor [Coprinopsis cinerea okayama7|uniref:Adenyl-nucleotide exchange factor n=1 Tax=Coprinopsis cinerea (strain Okayama-7 / 130 / ATCC MYA-4618 / FGSC 9003) TaxID=240176 RepID=A8NIL9_COPC7|nr:adenyl-nucleotide exchange factor [Coprinopsis cinerea okayama7\|eukprot:XP_001834027.1 adenyl-nucleotide exchange factor [Coprinopsis cinerea okayama7\